MKKSGFSAPQQAAKKSTSPVGRSACLLKEGVSMYCRKCGNEIKNGETFCDICGEKIAPNIKPVTNIDTKKYTAVAFLSLIVIIIGVFFFVFYDTEKPGTPPFPYDDNENPAYNSFSTTTTADNNGQGYSPTDYEEPVESTELADPQDVHKNGYYIIKNTPDGAGLSVRRIADSSSERLEIAAEGTIVKAIEEFHSLDNGYVKVETSTGVTGNVLAAYLYPYNPFDDSVPYSEYTIGEYVRVSYDLYDDASVPLYRAASSDSEIVTHLPEGAILSIQMSYSEDYDGYLCVEYMHPSLGSNCTGWIPVEHVDYYGNGKYEP